jgi:hypothetical protein
MSIEQHLFSHLYFLNPIFIIAAKTLSAAPRDHSSPSSMIVFLLFLGHPGALSSRLTVAFSTRSDSPFQ